MKVQMLELNNKLELLVQGSHQQPGQALPMTSAIPEKRTKRTGCDEFAGQAHHPKGKKQRKDVTSVITEDSDGPAEDQEDHEVSTTTEIVSKAIKDLVGFKDADGLDDNKGDCLSTFLISGSTLEP